MAARKNDVKTADSKKGKKNIFVRAGRAISAFFKNIYAELKKVTWPTKKQLLTSTLSVLAVCLVVGLIICGSDFILEAVINLITGY